MPVLQAASLLATLPIQESSLTGMLRSNRDVLRCNKEKALVSDPLSLRLVCAGKFACLGRQPSLLPEESTAIIREERRTFYRHWPLPADAEEIGSETEDFGAGRGKG